MNESERQLEIESIKEEFSEAVGTLTGVPRDELPPVEVRNWEVSELISEYLGAVGERPEPVELSRLADYILADTLRDPTPYKSNKSEYPIENGYQRAQAVSREMSTEGGILDYLHSKYHLRLDTLYRVNRIEKSV